LRLRLVFFSETSFGVGNPHRVEKHLLFMIFPEKYSVSRETVAEVEMGLRLALETEYSADFPASVKVCRVPWEMSNPGVLGPLLVPVGDLYSGAIAVAEPSVAEGKQRRLRLKRWWFMSSPNYVLSVRKGLDNHFAVLGQEITASPLSWRTLIRSA